VRCELPSADSNRPDDDGSGSARRCSTDGAVLVSALRPHDRRASRWGKIGWRCVVEVEDNDWRHFVKSDCSLIV
jgi:hypothetical protein